MITQSLHDVKKIKIRKIEKLSESLRYVRHIRIETDREFLELSLFSDNKEELEIIERD